MVLALATALCGIALPRATPAQSAEAQDSAAVGKETEYKGVVPGGEVEVRSPKRLRANRVTWIGFQPRTDGAARLFVQLTGEPSYSQALQDGALVVKIEGVRLHTSSVGRRLDTRFFDTALAQVTTRRVHKRRARKDRPAQTRGVELRIEFKNPADAREAEAALRTEEDGFHYLYLDFDPAGVRISE